MGNKRRSSSAPLLPKKSGSSKSLQSSEQDLGRTLLEFNVRIDHMEEDLKAHNGRRKKKKAKREKAEKGEEVKRRLERVLVEAQRSLQQLKEMEEGRTNVEREEEEEPISGERHKLSVNDVATVFLRRLLASRDLQADLGRCGQEEQAVQEEKN